MIIDAISDLHGFYPKLKGGDILIIAGDCTGRDSLKQWTEFFNWFKSQKYKYKILVAGNHDNFLESAYPKTEKQAKELEDFLQDMEKEHFFYLCDSGIEIEGIKFWGSPWTPLFEGVNPKCKAFMTRESKIEKKFSLIPNDIDVLITHSPPYMILDENIQKTPCGSITLRNQIDTRVFPKFHIFGHIHENFGQSFRLRRRSGKLTTCLNVSYIDGHYEPNGKPVRFEI